MKKSDLKTGMRVKTRDGCIFLVVCGVQMYGETDILFTDKDGGWLRGKNYQDNLICGDSDDNSFDIIEVYTINNIQDAFQGNFMNLEERYLIWKRKEFTDEQKEIFKALKTLGYNYIARDSDYSIYAFEKKPVTKLEYYWSSEGIVSFELETDKIMNKPHLNFIDWYDEEPFEIPEV